MKYCVKVDFKKLHTKCCKLLCPQIQLDNHIEREFGDNLGKVFCSIPVTQKLILGADLDRHAEIVYGEHKLCMEVLDFGKEMKLL